MPGSWWFSIRRVTVSTYADLDAPSHYSGIGEVLALKCHCGWFPGITTEDNFGGCRRLFRHRWLRNSVNLRKAYQHWPS